MKKGLCAVLTVVLCFVLISCSNGVENGDLWKNATYKENAEIGEGEKTITLEVVAEDKSIELIVRSNKETLGEALSEYKLIEGEQGAYGLYVKKVNGIVADYDINKSYWSLNKNGEYMTNGVDSEDLADGQHYEFVYTKQ